MLYSKNKLKGIKKYTIKSFIFYYNNYYLIHQEAKYVEARKVVDKA